MASGYIDQVAGAGKDWAAIPKLARGRTHLKGQGMSPEKIQGRQ